MTRQEWQQRTSPTEAFKCASGRRHYNYLRQVAALKRGLLVCQLLAQGYRPRAIAMQLGVHKNTVIRDLQRLQILTLRPSYFLRQHPPDPHSCEDDVLERTLMSEWCSITKL